MSFPRIQLPLSEDYCSPHKKRVDNETRNLKMEMKCWWHLQIFDFPSLSPNALLCMSVDLPFKLLVLSCLRHAASRVLVNIFLRLNAHPVLDAAHDIHLAVRLLQALKRSLLLLLREGEAELLLDRLVAAIVATRRKRQKLKRRKFIRKLILRAKEVFSKFHWNFNFSATWRYVTQLTLHEHSQRGKKTSMVPYRFYCVCAFQVKVIFFTFLSRFCLHEAELSSETATGK